MNFSNWPKVFRAILFLEFPILLHSGWSMQIFGLFLQNHHFAHAFVVVKQGV